MLFFYDLASVPLKTEILFCACKIWDCKNSCLLFMHKHRKLFYNLLTLYSTWKYFKQKTEQKLFNNDVLPVNNYDSFDEVNTWFIDLMRVYQPSMKSWVNVLSSGL